MKRIAKTGVAMALTVLLCLPTALFPSRAMAAERTITVNGKGIVSVLPDTATLYLGAQTIGKTAKDAQSENADIMDAILKKLYEMGIDKSSIKTSNFQVYPQYNYDDKAGEKTIMSYTASNILEITTKDINKVSEIFDKATLSGANINNGVQFSVTDSPKYYTDALSLALKNADINAKAIAQTLSVTIGTPVSIVEESSYNSFARSAGGAASMQSAKEDTANGASTSISYDNIDIQASITATYSY